MAKKVAVKKAGFVKAKKGQIPPALARWQAANRKKKQGK